ncbi:MAG: hypothetical protein M5U12_25740 [Verrucomicrobia bacterium]|nr:hypothetical protein [Verrucomicrobiota bacterium]
MRIAVLADELFDRGERLDPRAGRVGLLVTFDGFEAVKHPLPDSFHAAGSEMEGIEHDVIVPGLAAAGLEVSEGGARSPAVRRRPTGWRWGGFAEGSPVPRSAR